MTEDESSARDKVIRSLDDLLHLARAGRLHGIAYAVLKEDEYGGVEAVSNVACENNEGIKAALRYAAESVLRRLAPKATTEPTKPKHISAGFN
jgi:hypothetical protein